MQDSFYQSQNSDKTPVYLNVYSFCQCCNIACGWLGLGIYHTAIEVFGLEYMFTGNAGNATGVIEVWPKSSPYKFENQILLGYTSLSYHEFDYRVIQPLKKKYISNTYDLFNNNCNHFALALSEKLNLQNNHPKSYVFRMTDCANMLRCCLPRCILSGKLDWFSSDGSNDEIDGQQKYSELIEQKERTALVRCQDERSDVSTGSNKRHNIFPKS